VNVIASCIVFDYVRFFVSHTQFKMRRDESCKVVCRTKPSQEAVKNFKEKIDDEYRVNMYGLMLNLVISVEQQWEI
jgi:hypothetical protein